MKKIGGIFNMSTIQVPYQEFRQMVSTFCKELDTFDYDEMDNAHKCVVLAYFGLGDITEREQLEAEILLKITSKKFIEHEYQLNKSATSSIKVKYNFP